MKNNMKKSILVCTLLAGVWTMAFGKPKYISPNNDGIQDELVIPLNISDKRYVKSLFKQIVTPKKGVEIPKEMIWNGAMNNGETAPDGKYFYYVTATDDNGNQGKTKEYEVIVDTLAPEIELAQPKDKIFGEGSKSAFKIKQTGSVEDEWIGTIKNADRTCGIQLARNK